MTKPFDDELLTCIDSVLSSSGPNIKTVIVSYLERKGIKFEEIPRPVFRIFKRDLRELPQ